MTFNCKTTALIEGSHIQHNPKDENLAISLKVFLCFINFVDAQYGFTQQKCHRTSDVILSPCINYECVDLGYGVI